MAIILQVLFLSVPEYASVNNSVEKKKKKKRNFYAVTI